MTKQDLWEIISNLEPAERKRINVLLKASDKFGEAGENFVVDILLDNSGRSITEIFYQLERELNKTGEV